MSTNYGYCILVPIIYFSLSTNSWLTVLCLSEVSKRQGEFSKPRRSGDGTVLSFLYNFRKKIFTLTHSIKRIFPFPRKVPEIIK